MDRTYDKKPSRTNVSAKVITGQEMVTCHTLRQLAKQFSIQSDSLNYMILGLKRPLLHTSR